MIADVQAAALTDELAATLRSNRKNISTSAFAELVSVLSLGLLTIPEARVSMLAFFFVTSPARNGGGRLRNTFASHYDNERRAWESLVSRGYAEVFIETAQIDDTPDLHRWALTQAGINMVADLFRWDSGIVVEGLATRG